MIYMNIDIIWELQGIEVSEAGRRFGLWALPLLSRDQQVGWALGGFADCPGVP